MLNQKCTIIFGEMTGYVIDAVTRRLIRGGVAVDVVIAWNDGDITSFPVSEVPTNVQIESVLNSICRISKDGELGNIMLFTEAKVVKADDSPINAIVLWDNSSVSVEEISCLTSLVAENPPSTISMGNGSGSGVTAIWTDVGSQRFERTTAGSARIEYDDGGNGEVKIFIEKVANDLGWEAVLSSYHMVSIERSEDGRYIGVFLNNKNKGNSKTHVAYLKNMVDGISITLYKILPGGGLSVVMDYGLVLEDSLVDEIIE